MLSLSALRLRPDSVVWDIGTCTGSVAIEAAKIARDGAVFAIEKMNMMWKFAGKTCANSASTSRLCTARPLIGLMGLLIRMPSLSAARQGRWRRCWTSVRNG